MTSDATPGQADLELENARLRALLREAGSAPSPPTDASAASMARQLDEQQAFTRLLIDSVSEGFYATDRQGRTTLCNAAFLRLLGYEREEEVLGKTLHALIHHSHPDGSPYALAACPIYRAGLDGTSAVVTSELFFRRDGTSFPVEYRAEPIVRDGALQGTIVTFVDITTRLAAEARQRESERRLALALEASGIGIWDYSPGSGRLEWDDRVRAIFGMAPGRTITLERNVAALHPSDRPRIEKALEEAFDPSGSGRYDVEFRAIGIEDGRERWVAANGQTTFVNGAAHRFIGTARDITEKKRSELHLRLMVNELNHRVKNSLAMVQGVAAQTFRSTDNIEAARKAFTERLVALARAHDVLTATKWESGDLREVVALVVDSHAGDEADRFDIAGPEAAISPKAVLSIAMALHELATNAVKYGALSTPQGQVTVRWALPNVDGERRLSFRWVESGGPVVVPPQRRGFGLKMIERGLAAELQGEVRIEFLKSGVVCTIDAPYEAP